jgi:hypothetical protein
MELRPFGNLTLTLSSDGLFMLGDTPVGRRIIQEIAAIEFKGEHFTAQLKVRLASATSCSPSAPSSRRRASTPRSINSRTQKR